MPVEFSFNEVLGYLRKGQNLAEKVGSLRSLFIQLSEVELKEHEPLIEAEEISIHKNGSSKKRIKSLSGRIKKQGGDLTCHHNTMFSQRLEIMLRDKFEPLVNGYYSGHCSSLTGER